MKKFNKEDTGVYVSLVLAGMGIGLVLGSVISAWLLREEGDIYDDEEFEETYPAEGGSENDRTDQKKEPRGRVEAISKGDRDEAFDKAFKALTEKYTVTNIQAGLVEQGFMTIEELEDQLASQEAYGGDPAAELTDYSSLYDGKPGLEALVQVDHTKDAQFVIMADIPEENKQHKLPVITTEYHTATDMLIRQTNDGRWVEIRDPHVMVGETTLNDGLDMYLAGIGDIVVYDRSRNRYVRIRFVAEEER
jgi:hypothetical protein